MLHVSGQLPKISNCQFVRWAFRIAADCIIYDKLEFIYVENAKFTPQEIREYEASKMAYRDIKNSIDTAKREGRIEANIETAQRLLAMGLPTEQVAKATQLPLDMVQNLSN